MSIDARTVDKCNAVDDLACPLAPCCIQNSFKSDLFGLGAKSQVHAAGASHVLLPSQVAAAKSAFEASFVPLNTSPQNTDAAVQHRREFIQWWQAPREPTTLLSLCAHSALTLWSRGLLRRCVARSVLTSGQLAFSLRLLRHLRQVPPSGVDEPVADL